MDHFMWRILFVLASAYVVTLLMVTFVPFFAR